MSAVNGPALAPSKPDSVLGHLVARRYRVIRQLSEGPIGTVYFADDLGTGNRVALRVLGSEFARDEQFARAFARHALMLAALCRRSDAIPKVYEDHADDSALLVAMEYVDGKSLGAVIQEEEALPVGRALRLAIQIAEGLETAHSMELVHGGLTPQNVVVTGRGDIKLMDFGIAGLRNTAAGTASRSVIGAEYLAPEQLEGEEITEKADIYALGAVLYQMLCGAAPFTTTGPNVALAKQLYEAPALPRKSRRKVPSSLQQIVMRALDRRPDRRPDIQGLLQDLWMEERRWENRGWDESSGAVPALVGAVKEFAVKNRRLSTRWKLVTSCALLALIVMPAIWIALSYNGSENIPVPQPPQKSDPGTAGQTQTSDPKGAKDREMAVNDSETAAVTAVRVPPAGTAEGASGKLSPEVSASRTMVAPVPSPKASAISRERAGPSAPARDNPGVQAESSDPSDPAGVIEWLLKEHSAKNR